MRGVWAETMRSIRNQAKRTLFTEICIRIGTFLTKLDIAELASSFWSQDHIVLLDTVARELISGQRIRSLTTQTRVRTCS